MLDDEESIRSLLEEGLNAYGLRVVCAATAEEAAKLAAAENFDAVLCDLNLAGGSGSGQEAAAQVVAASKVHKPLVIFMTGDLAAGLEGHAGFENSAFLQKPFRIAEVMNILREALTTAPIAKS